MKSTKTLMAMLAAGLLALNLSSQAQTTNAPPAGGRNARGRAAGQQLDQLFQQLNLTDDQKPKVRAVMQDQRKKMQELRADSSGSPQDLRAKRQALLQDTNKKMREILTPEQFKKFEESLQQQRGNRGAGRAAGNARPNRNRNGANPPKRRKAPQNQAAKDAA